MDRLTLADKAHEGNWRGVARLAKGPSRRALGVVASVTLLLALLMLLGASSSANASGQSQVTASQKAKPSKQFKKRYAKAKRSLRRCQWSKAYRQFYRIRKNAVRFYDYRAMYNLSVSAYSSGRKGIGRAWARRGVKRFDQIVTNGGFPNQMMGITMIEIAQDDYIVECRR